MIGQSIKAATVAPEDSNSSGMPEQGMDMPCLWSHTDCCTGLVAPSKHHSVFLKHIPHRLCTGPVQDWCTGRETFFSLVLQLDTSRILKNIFPHASLKWHLVFIRFASQLAVIIAQPTPWYRGVRLKNDHIGFPRFLHFLSNTIPVSDRRENLCSWWMQTGRY